MRFIWNRISEMSLFSLFQKQNEGFTNLKLYFKEHLAPLGQYSPDLQEVSSFSSKSQQENK